MSWFNDFIGRFSQETKPRPQKLANIIDRLTPALEVLPYILVATCVVSVCVCVQVMPTVYDEVGRLGGGSFLTEFGICDPDGDAQTVDTVECEFVMQQADLYLQSWTYWDSLFFNDSLHG